MFKWYEILKDEYPYEHIYLSCSSNDSFALIRLDTLPDDLRNYCLKFSLDRIDLLDEVVIRVPYSDFLEIWKYLNRHCYEEFWTLPS